MRSISKSGVLILTGRDCGPRGVEVECVSGLTQCQSTYYIAENATAGDQQMIGSRRQIDGLLETNHLSCCGIVKYYPKLLPMIVLSALLCKKSPNCASGKQRPTMFDPCCYVHSFDDVAMSSVHQPSWRYHPSANPGSEHTFEPIYASAASAPRSSSVAPTYTQRTYPHSPRIVAQDSLPAKPWQQRT